MSNETGETGSAKTAPKPIPIRLLASDRLDEMLAELSDTQAAWVRANGFGTRWWADDLVMLAKNSVGGVMLAMVESVDHVTETAKRLPGVPMESEPRPT